MKKINKTKAFFQTNSKWIWSLCLFFVLIASAHATIIVPGVDANITYNSSTKGIWWSTMSIYAKTGISVGDIIQIPYNASNSTDSGLFPLLLKVHNVDQIICVNSLLHTISPYSSYPVCFYNNDILNLSKGFNYSVMEAQNLFSTKTYDIVWGKYSNIDFLIDTFSNFTNFMSIAKFNSSQNLTSNNFLLGKNYYINASYSVLSGTYSPSPSGWSYKYIGDNKTYLLDYTLSCGILYQDQSEAEIVGIKSVSCINSGQGFTGSYYGSGPFELGIYHEQTNYGPASVKYNLESKVVNYSILIPSNAGNDLLANQIDTSYNFSDGNNSLKFQNFSNNQFNFSLNLNGVNYTLPLEPFFKSKSFVNITRKSTDPINGLNLVPYQTKSNWPQFVTVDALNGSNLFYNLNSLDLPTTTNNVNSYLKTGNNSILLSQTNKDGGYWMFFKGQYNSPPTLSPGPTLNVSQGLFYGEDIYCNGGTYHDAESDPQSGIEFGWWKNGVQTTPITQNLNISSLSIVKGDLVKCGERVNDGTSWSQWYYSSELPVLGAKPTGNLTLSPSSPTKGQNVICSIKNLSDVDGENVTATLKWFKNSTILINSSPVLNMSGGNLTLSNSSINASLAYSCVATLNDSTTLVNITQSFGLGIVPPTITRPLSINTSFVYDNFVFEKTGCLGTDVNGNPLTYTYEYSNDSINWSVAETTTADNFSWDTSAIPQGHYFIRCKASDGLANSQYVLMPGNITIQKYQISSMVNANQLYSTRLTVSSDGAVNPNQYNNGNVGFLAGDDSSNSIYSLISYLPIKFDGHKRFTQFSITPTLAYSNGVSIASGTVSDYDVIVYQTDAIGNTVLSNPLTAYYNVNMNIGEQNNFSFSVVPGQGQYVAVKVCRNANQLTNKCGSDGNGKDDYLIVYGDNSAGTYIAKVKQGDSVYTSAYNLNVKFDWEKASLGKVKTAVDINYANGMTPQIIVNENNGDPVCGSPTVALKEGIPSCIEQISSSKYLIDSEYLEDGLPYDILGGKTLDFKGPGSQTANVDKNSLMTSSVRMSLLGSEYLSSFTSSPSLTINSNSIWNTIGSFSTDIKTNPLNSVLTDGTNALSFTSDSPGSLVFWFEPIYTNLSVTHSNNITPIAGALSTLPVSFTTNMLVDPQTSYCAFEKNGLLKTKATISGTNGNYKCVPTLNSSAVPGSYQVVVHIEDVSGVSDEYVGTVSVADLLALSVDPLDFNNFNYASNSSNKTLRILVNFQNTGNLPIHTLNISAKLNKFWDNAGVVGFNIQNLLDYSSSLEGLNSNRDKHLFSISSSNNLLIGNISTTLNPGSSQAIAFELNLSQVHVPVNEYVGEFLVGYSQ